MHDPVKKSLYFKKEFDFSTGDVYNFIILRMKEVNRR